MLMVLNLSFLWHYRRCPEVMATISRLASFGPAVLALAKYEFWFAKYTVQPGDTIWDLEHEYQLPPGTLLRVNPGLQTEGLSVGATISLPSKKYMLEMQERALKAPRRISIEPAMPPRDGTDMMTILWDRGADADVPVDIKFDVVRSCANGLRYAFRVCAKWAKCNLTEADAIVFHKRQVQFDRLPPAKPVNQPWIVFSLESPSSDARYGHYPPNDAFWRLFDLAWGYQLDADIPAPYFPRHFTERYWLDLFKSATPQGRRTDVPVAWLASNCEPSNCRTQYVVDLMQHVPVHSFGRCLRNMPPMANKADALGRYKFYLSFENSNCWDYCTEKLLECYQSGAIPIVMGCHNRAFLPHPKAALFVEDFASPWHLAQHILAIHQNDTLYREHREARQLSPLFRKHFVNHSDPQCHLASTVRHFQEHHRGGAMHGRHHPDPDFSCSARQAEQCYGANLSATAPSPHH